MPQFELTEKQIKILNDLKKYDPAWREFSSDGVDFGSVFQSTQDQVTDLQTTVETIEGGTISTTLVFSSPSNLILGTIPADKRVILATIDVLNSFNGSIPSITIGTDSNPSLIMSEDESAIDEVLTFVSTPAIKFTSETELKVFFNSGGSTIGNCVIAVSFS